MSLSSCDSSFAQLVLEVRFVRRATVGQMPFGRTTVRVRVRLSNGVHPYPSLAIIVRCICSMPIRVYSEHSIIIFHRPVCWTAFAPYCVASTTHFAPKKLTSASFVADFIDLTLPPQPRTAGAEAHLRGRSAPH